MSNSTILYNNLLDNTTTVTVTSEASGFAKENVFDWLTWDFWKPIASGTVYYTMDFGSAITVDVWGIAAHDLGENGASIQLQYSATGAWAGEEVNFDSAVSPTAGEPILQTGSSQSERYWRWKIVSASVASSIGIAMLGAKLELATELRPNSRPDLLAQQYEPAHNVSVDAAFLGTDTYKKPIQGKMQFTLLTPAWVRTNWEPFVRHVELGKGFLYLADPDNYSGEVTYAFSTLKIQAARYTHANHMSVELSYVGIVS